ncbi:regulation of nuclear pre-mRNA domain-containing protein 2-like [Anneissia japonica]|uniref:regulation of nuclear pre-mRNA domain-containing protein 2-like n=1 Tax=Anneissia japonica TaxID=1529436 RepID=UPI001425794F|nr:regulation of nuclear pre-mRNA domain-containing protein 2-like [Anneissia japonica]
MGRDHHRSSRKKSKKKSYSKSELKESSTKFNVGSLQQKLKSLNNTQDSVQSVSLWIIHHKNHVTNILATWLQEVKESSISKRLILMYLANDVIQNSRRRGITTFVDGFGEAFVEAVSLCRDDSIRKNIERLFKIWEQRNIYDNDAIEKFQDAISTEKDAQAKANAQILVEYKPDELPESMEKLVHFEGEVDLKRKQLSNMNVDVTSTEAIMQLKDRAGGKRFSKHFEDATNKLDDYVQSLSKEVEMRQDLLELLEKSVVFYEAQFGEAKIVANAYKNFGTRVGNLKKRLDEYRKLIPNDSLSPIPSPSSDAPSPGATPPRDPNQDTTELEDMDMSEDDDTDSKNVGSVVATTSRPSRSKPVTSSKKQAPLASLPGPPTVGQPISTIAGQVGKYADETQESYSPGSNTSAPSPIGTPEGLNLSPNSSQTAPESNIYVNDTPAQPTASYQATAQNLLPQIPSPDLAPFPAPVNPLPTKVAPVPPVSYTSASSSTYSMYTQATPVQYSSTYAPPSTPTISTPESTALYSSNTYYQNETAGSTGYSATPINTPSQPTTSGIYSQNYTPSTYNAPPYYAQQSSQEGGYSTAQTTSNQYSPPAATDLYSPTMPTPQQSSFTATNSYNPTVPPPNYGTNYTPTAPNPPPPLPPGDYKPAPPPVEETFVPSNTQNPTDVNYSDPQVEYQTPGFQSGNDNYGNSQSQYGTENYKPYDNQNTSYPGNNSGYQQTGYTRTDETHTGFNSGSTLDSRNERELMQQAKTNPIGFLTRIITASKQPRNTPRSNLLNNLTALKTVPTVDDQTFKTKSESERNLQNIVSDHPTEVDMVEEKSTGSLDDNQEAMETQTKPRSILKRRQAPEVINTDLEPPKREKIHEPPKIKSSHSIALGAFLSSLQQDDDDDDDEDEDEEEDKKYEKEDEKAKSVNVNEPEEEFPNAVNVVIPKTENSPSIVNQPMKTDEISTIKNLGDKPLSGLTHRPPPGPPPGPPPVNAKRGPLNINQINPVKSLAKDTVKEAPRLMNIEPTPIPVLGAPVTKPVLKRRLSSVVVPAKNYSEDNDWETNNTKPDYRDDYYQYDSMEYGHDRGRYDDYRQRRRPMEAMEYHRHQSHGGGHGGRYEDNRYRYDRGQPYYDYGTPQQHRPPVRGGRPPPYYRY